MKMGWIAVVSVGLCCALVSAVAQTDPALSAWLAGDRQAAVSAWRTRAVQGDAEASLFLGYLYRRGVGLVRDDAQAAHWYRRAAQSGHPEAQYELALMYELGLGVEQDPEEAAKWYALATAQTCPAETRAAARLGVGGRDGR